MKKEILGYGIVIILGVLAIVSLMCRAEQVDKQKELPATQSNSVNLF